MFKEYRATLALLADRVGRLVRVIQAALPTLAPAQQALVGALATLRGVQTDVPRRNSWLNRPPLTH